MLENVPTIVVIKPSTQNGQLGISMYFLQCSETVEEFTMSFQLFRYLPFGISSVF
jgi:hypothetical protein